MMAKKISASAEEMKQKLFGAAQDKHEEAQVKPPIIDRFAVYLDHVGKTVTIPIEHIVIEDNVRKEVETSSPKFQELVDSIKRDGLLQNLIVEVRKGQTGTYLSCVSGQRRLLAARAAGAEKAVCLLKEYSPAERVSTGLTENLVRQDLNCIDIAEGYSALRKEGWSEEEIAARFERGQRTIHRYLVIASWPEDIKQSMRKYPDVFTTRAIFNQFVSKGFKSEAALREAVNSKLVKALQPGSEKLKTVRTTRSQVKSVGLKLSDKLKLPVAVKGNDQKGIVTISYHNREQLEKIVKILEESNPE
jgi:ParB family transcriptional regulator, chromosome partitioning protein